jgi:hypothetical protein
MGLEPECRLRAIGDAEFVEEAAQLVAHGELAFAQSSGNLLVAGAASQGQQDLAFAARQVGRVHCHGVTAPSNSRYPPAGSG